MLSDAINQAHKIIVISFISDRGKKNDRFSLLAGAGRILKYEVVVVFFKPDEQGKSTD